MIIKIIAVFIAVVTVVIGVYTLLLHQNLFTYPSQSTSLQKITVRLDWLAQAQYAGMFVASEKGFYKAHGLDVVFKEYKDGLDQTAEVADGKVDFGITTGVELLSSVNSGKKVKGIAVIYQTSPEAFATLKSSHILSPQDFKGKILGSKGGNPEAHVVYSGLLNKFAISKSQVTLKDLDYAVDVDGDLLQHRADVVDLYRTDEAHILTKKGIQYNLILPESYGFSVYGDTLIASQKLIDQNPQEVRNFVIATLEGWNYAIAHPEEAIQTALKYATTVYPDTDNSYKNLDQESFILHQSIPLIQQPGRGSIGSMSYIIWNGMANEMQTDGLLQKNFDVTSAYTTKFLNQQ